MPPCCVVGTSHAAEPGALLVPARLGHLHLLHHAQLAAPVLCAKERFMPVVLEEKRHKRSVTGGQIWPMVMVMAASQLLISLVMQIHVQRRPQRHGRMKEKWASKDHVMKGDENCPLKTRATWQPGLSELSCSNSPLCPVSRCHLLPPSGPLQREFGIARPWGCGCQHAALSYRGYCPCPGRATKCCRRCPSCCAGLAAVLPATGLPRD